MAETKESLQAQIAALTAANAALQARVAARTSMHFKVSEKGALSIYGVQRFPVTLYREQWERILAKADEIRKFIQDNDKTLTRKTDA